MTDAVVSEEDITPIGSISFVELLRSANAPLVVIVFQLVVVASSKRDHPLTERFDQNCAVPPRPTAREMLHESLHFVG